MLNAIVSFFTAILAGMGVGSGGIMVVWFTFAASMPQLEAQLLNLIFFAASSVAALFINLVKKRLSLSVVLPMAASGCIFAVGAALLAKEIDSSVLRKSFGILMILMSAISTFYTLKSTGIFKKNEKIFKSYK